MFHSPTARTQTDSLWKIHSDLGSTIKNALEESRGAIWWIMKGWTLETEDQNCSPVIQSYRAIPSSGDIFCSPVGRAPLSSVVSIFWRALHLGCHDRVRWCSGRKSFTVFRPGVHRDIPTGRFGVDYARMDGISRCDLVCGIFVGRFARRFWANLSGSGLFPARSFPSSVYRAVLAGDIQGPQTSNLTDHVDRRENDKQTLIT